jgi:hypothetical protein
VKALRILILFLLLSACDGEGPRTVFGGDGAGDALDEQAIEKGLLPDPDSRSLAGQYETRSDLGVDKFCATESGGSKRFGMLAVFGPETKCEGTGSVVYEGSKLTLTFEGKKSCTFEAEYDGVAIRFPGSIGPGCASYCSPRASMSGTQYFLIEKGNESARLVLGRDIKRLCS